MGSTLSVNVERNLTVEQFGWCEWSCALVARYLLIVLQHVGGCRDIVELRPYEACVLFARNMQGYLKKLAKMKAS